MLMDEGMDTGPMLLQERIPILPEDTAGTLAPRLAELGGRLLVETIAQLNAGTLTARQQDHAQATIAPLLKKEDGLLDWGMSAQALANRVRGLSPWPGAYTFYGQERWNIWKAAPLQEPTQDLPGTIIGSTKHSLLVATGNGRLELLELQTANYRRMPVWQFLTGHRIDPGSKLGAANV
jgi:methionyl-tRNA formyltransferase